jgi:hypothetical protein
MKLLRQAVSVFSSFPSVDLNGFVAYGPAAGFLVLWTPGLLRSKVQSDTSSECLAQSVVNIKCDVFRLREHPEYRPSKVTDPNWLEALEAEGK